MANLSLPRDCTVCGLELVDGDKITMERTATIQVDRRYGARVLRPRIAPRRPQNVRHTKCPVIPDA